MMTFFYHIYKNNEFFFSINLSYTFFRRFCYLLFGG